MPSPDTHTDNIHKSSGAKKLTNIREEKILKGPKMLEETKKKKRQFQKRLPAPTTLINEQGPPKK